MTILISCCNGDGGLFALDEQSLGLSKLIDSEMRGIDYYDGLLYSCDHDGIDVWEIDLEGISSRLVYRREQPAEWHGLRVRDGRVYVVDAPGDTIHVFDLQLNPLDDLKISLRQPGEGRDIRRHVNDICFDSFGDMLFSSFSLDPQATYINGDGNIRRMYQGQPEIIETGLRHPHSVTTHYGSLWWCDSSNDRVTTRKRNGQIESFPVVGYPRGLVITGEYIYVGISEDRHDGQKAGRAGVVRISRKKHSESVTIPVSTREVYGLVRI